MAVEKVAVLVARGDTDENLDVTAVGEDWEFVLGNVGAAAGVRPVVAARARRDVGCRPVAMRVMGGIVAATDTDDGRRAPQREGGRRIRLRDHEGSLGMGGLVGDHVFLVCER